MTWVVQRHNGEPVRAPNGLPLYAETKQEAEQMARTAGLRPGFYVIVLVRD